MAQIGTLVTGAGVVTTIGPNNGCEQYIVIGDVDTAMPLRGLNVQVNDKPTINIVGSQPLMSAFSKFMSQVAGTVTGLVIKIGTGKLPGKATYRFTNDGVTTPAIFAFSGQQLQDKSFPIKAVTVGINAASYEDFTNFSALMITPSANVGDLEVTFRDKARTKTTISVIEADALFTMGHPAQADGRLDAVVTTIDNRDGSIESVRVNATTAVTVLKISLDDADFAELK